MDYHERPPQSGDPQDPSTPRRIRTESPIPRRYDIVPPEGRGAHESYGSEAYPPDPDSYEEDRYPSAEPSDDFPGWSAPTSRHGYVSPARHDFPTQSRPLPSRRPYDDDARQRGDWRDDFGDTVSWVDPSHARNAAARLANEASVAAHVPSRGGFDGGDRDYPAVLWWTGIWYAIPVLAYAVWTVMLSGAPRAGCTTTSGRPCASPQFDALTAVVHNIVGIVLAIVISFSVAVWIRGASLSWRAISVGFAAVVIGSGAATIVTSL